PWCSEYGRAAHLHVCSVVSVRAKEENRFVPTEEELRFLVMRSDLVFLGCPNNRNGLLPPKPVLERVAAEAARSGAVLVLDEAFIDSVPVGEARSLIHRLCYSPTTPI